MTLSVRTDRKLVRAGARSTRYALVSFEAPVAPDKAGRRPVNVALVLDRSGSMGGEKIRLAREAIRQALRTLRPADRFSLVVYDDRIDVIVVSTHATPEAVRNALARLEAIDARGNTNLGGGWLKGCEQVAEAVRGDETINRCLLATDGLANEGITDAGELSHHAGELRTRGVVTSTFGIGADFDENLLRGMADAGGGHFYFIEKAVQIPDCLTGELGEALEVVARDAVLHVEVPSGMEVEPLNALRHGRTPQGIDIALGDLVSGQDVELVVKFRFPTASVGDTVVARFALADRDHALGDAWQANIWMYADHEENDRQDRDRVVDRAVARIYAARARAEALELNRKGNFEQARHVLDATRRKILEYAGDDPELRAIAEELVHEFEVVSAPMSAMQMKVGYARSYNLLAMRDPSGKSRKRPPQP
jgi:Ca-activated chloride channel family protein